MATRKKYHLLFAIFVSACFSANIGIAKDLTQSKKTADDSPVKSLQKSGEGKHTSKGAQKSSRKPVVEKGFCIVKTKLVTLSKTDCARKKGTFYTDKRQADKILASEKKGFCLAKGKVVSATVRQCKASSGQFYNSRSAASKSYETQKGYCLKGKVVSSSTRGGCSGKGRQFFSDRRQADKALAMLRGFCLLGDSVSSSSYSQCLKKRGTFFADRRSAAKKAKANRKLAASSKSKASRAKVSSLAGSGVNHERLSAKRGAFSKSVTRQTPVVDRSRSVEDRMGNRHLKERLAGMKEAQAAKDAGVIDMDPSAGRQTQATDPRTGEPISIKRGISRRDRNGKEQDVLTGRDKVMSSLEEYDPRYQSGRRSDGKKDPGEDELRAAARSKGGMDRDVDDDGSDFHNPYIVGDKTIVYGDVTFGEATLMAMGAHKTGASFFESRNDAGQFKVIIGIPGGYDNANKKIQVRVEYDNGEIVVKDFAKGKHVPKGKDGKDENGDLVGTPHPDEQRNSRPDKKRKALTRMDLAGNNHPDAYNEGAKEKNKKKKTFKDDELAGTPSEAQDEQAQRTAPGVMTGALLLNGTPVDGDIDFGTVTPGSISGGVGRGGVTGGGIQQHTDALLPETGNQTSFEAEQQQEEPAVVVPDN